MLLYRTDEKCGIGQLENFSELEDEAEDLELRRSRARRSRVRRRPRRRPRSRTPRTAIRRPRRMYLRRPRRRVRTRRVRPGYRPRRRPRSRTLRSVRRYPYIRRRRRRPYLRRRRRLPRRPPIFRRPVYIKPVIGITPVPLSEPSPKPLGSSVTHYYKDSPRLRSVSLKPTSPIRIDQSWPFSYRAIANTYNRLGGLIGAIADEAKVDVPAALAVWYVESGGRSHTPGQAIIRFENHVFYDQWGRDNEGTYNQYFRHGGHNGQPGRRWENHQFREGPDEQFRKFHGNQALEYRVLRLAMNLAGKRPALSSISIGGPQIMGFNYRLIGYSSPQQMYDAFQAGERAHVLGFFDFCRHRKAPRKGDLMRYLRAHKWIDFARFYNGPGNAEKYADRIQNAYHHAQEIV